MFKGDTSSAFAQECCVLKDFQAILYSPDTGTLLSIEQEIVVDFEIRVTPQIRNDGYLIFEDTIDFQEILGKTTNLWLHLFYVENDGSYIRRDFKVTSTSKSSISNQVSVRLDLQDSLSYTLSKSFKAGNFPSLSKCLESLYNNYFKDADFKEPQTSLPGGLEGFRCYYGIKVLDDYKGSITIPGNTDILTGFENELSRLGYICYQEDNVLYLINIKSIKPKELGGIDAVYKKYPLNQANTEFYLYYDKFLETPRNQQKPKTKTLSIDYTNKELNMIEQNLIDTTLSDEFTQESKGFELNYSESGNENKEYMKTFFNFLDTNSGRIVIPARKKYLKMFNLIRIEANNPSSKSGVGDIKNSGYFIITGYVNKLFSRERLTSLVKISRF